MGQRCILVVEDEPLIAMMLEDFLEFARPFGQRDLRVRVSDALIEAEKGGFDLAILDVNLKGESVWPVAERLRDQHIPFVLATGGHVDPPPAAVRQRPSDRKALHGRPGHPRA